MGRSRRILLFVFLTILGMASCLWIANQVYAGHCRRTMDRALHSVQYLRLHESTMMEAISQLQFVNNGKYEQRVDADGDREIDIHVIAPQGGFRKLGRIILFSITLTFDSSDRLNSRRVTFMSNSALCCSVEVWELSSSAGPQYSGFKVLRYTPYSVIVHSNSDASAIAREGIWNWQLSCLTSFGGCNDARQILPILRLAGGPGDGWPRPQ